MLSGSRLAVDRALEDFLHGVATQLNGIAGELLPMSKALGEFLAGGKRLRPLFALAGYVGAGGAGNSAGEAPTPEIYRALISLELLQACALIHDDMMDGSDTRRGAPSIHRRFEKEHRLRNGVGASEDFGNAAALLMGDLALVLSAQALHASGISDAQLRIVAPVFDIMKVELMAGQYLDMHAGSQDQVSVEDTLKIATYKSGKYTIERPLHFGGALALASREIFEIYSAYGIPLGIAFQMRDDLLGVFGDSAVTGKPAGDDLLEGKRTALIAYAVNEMDKSDAQEFAALFGNRNARDLEITRMRELIRNSGAVDFIESVIKEKTQLALAAAEHQEISKTGQELLRELAILATQRSA